MADKPARPSPATLWLVGSYSVASMVPFGLSDKSPWVFLALCLVGMPLAVWRVRADQARWRRGERW